MSLATALLTPILGDASPWTPRRLFQLGEAGGVYDPSDLTAEKVAWRRNLLTWSEDFTNAAWTKTNGTVTPNTDTAPDGTLTADTFAATSANAVLQLDPARSGLFTNSIYLKRKTGTGAVQLLTPDGTYTAVTLTGAWQRFQLSANATASLFRVRVVASGDEVYVWGAQQEFGSTATAYQRITDFTSDFLAAFPTHGLYQDAAGTTPVTALGQPVGLVIDSKTGGLANLGPEQLSNTDFTSNVTGWSAANAATLTWDSSGAALLDITGAGGGIQDNQTLALVAGRSYRLEIRVRAGTYTGAYAVLVGGVTLTTLPAAPSTAYQTYYVYFTAASADPTVLIARGTGVTGTVFFDSISLREVPGVHAIQPTNSSRPLLDGRVNRLERTEEFDNAYWTKTGGATITANTAVAPDGTTTADTLTAPSGGLNRGARRVGATLVANTAFVRWVYAKRSTSDWVYLVSYDVGAGIGAWFNVNTGQVGTVQAGVTASIEPAPNGYYRCIVSWSVGSSVAFNEMDIMLTNADNTTTSSTGNAVFIWGADLRLATDAAYPYQRVAAATDYADVGVPRSFLFDGFDDSLYTASNMDLSGTDKVTVLAGVRKLSDAGTTGVIMETGASLPNGSFFVRGPEPGGTGSIGVGARGSGTIAYYSPTGLNAPITQVVTGLLNLAAVTTATQVIPRFNGVVIQSGATTGPTTPGNFASLPLYIGRTSLPNLPFNGKAYQLIVRGALTDAATLAQAERYVGAKTGLYL